MAELKTKVTHQSPKDFLNTIQPEQKKKDGFALLAMFEKVTGYKAVMWGKSIVGFGKYHYKSERSRQEGDWPMVGFSPRKQALTLYLMLDSNAARKLLPKLGKHTRSVGCLYLKKLDDVDQEVLRALIKESFNQIKEKYPPA